MLYCVNIAFIHRFIVWRWTDVYSLRSCAGTRICIVCTAKRRLPFTRCASSEQTRTGKRDRRRRIIAMQKFAFISILEICTPFTRPPTPTHTSIRAHELLNWDWLTMSAGHKTYVGRRMLAYLMTPSYKRWSFISRFFCKNEIELICDERN